MRVNGNKSGGTDGDIDRFGRSKIKLSSKYFKYSKSRTLDSW